MLASDSRQKNIKDGVKLADSFGVFKAKLTEKSSSGPRQSAQKSQAPRICKLNDYDVSVDLRPSRNDFQTKDTFFLKLDEKEYFSRSAKKLQVTNCSHEAAFCDCVATRKAGETLGEDNFEKALSTKVHVIKIKSDSSHPKLHQPAAHRVGLTEA